LERANASSSSMPSVERKSATKIEKTRNTHASRRTRSPERAQGARGPGRIASGMGRGLSSTMPVMTLALHG
jgi:hypothetical protein